jgi:hypothetical protein
MHIFTGKVDSLCLPAGAGITVLLQALGQC